MVKRFCRRRAIAGAVAVAMAAGTSPFAQQPGAEPPRPAATALNVPARFTGQWDYNDDESINAGTGRREQTPQSATARSAANNAPRSPQGAPAPAAGPSGFDSGTGVYRALPTVTASMIRDAENFVRDLLEVPEQLQIRVDDGSVTFVDDLSRERIYQTDGKGREYQLSAAKFDARVTWDGVQLKREVTGGRGFKIFETYFLSDDGDRMFVIIRVKSPTRPGFIAGFNRVYDRVSQPGPVAR